MPYIVARLRYLTEGVLINTESYRKLPKSVEIYHQNLPKGKATESIYRYRWFSIAFGVCQHCLEERILESRHDLSANLARNSLDTVDQSM